jgi:predicted HicB family RNase H-like nuclease
MSHDGSDNRQKLRAITVRLPEKEYTLIREYAKNHDLSMNMVISDAIAEYGAKVTRREALERIRLLQQRQRERREPVGDSVELLRQMRAERSEQLGGTKE